MVPGVPNYDGVRLFLPVFPFLALLAGVGVQNGWRWVVRRSRSRPWRPLFLLVAFFLSQAGATVLIHPYELSYYNALVGGLWGADRLGLETTYWHDPVNRAVFGWLNRRCVTNQAVAFYPVSEFAVVLPFGEAKTHVPNFYDFYLNSPDPSKRLRAERIDSGVPCGFLVLNAREAMLRRHEEAWRVWTTRRPVFAIRKQGVRLCAVFEAEPPRRRARRAGE
jgi:hypothetical protein